MSRPFIYVIQTIGVLLFALSQKQDIKLTHDAPASLRPGEEAVVNIALDKADVLGFAKFQITFDEGITAEVIEGAAASFTFNNQVAKFIWMVLPSNRKINLKIRIKASEDAAGLLQLNQRFSYIYDNERKNFDAPTHTIMVGEIDALSAMQSQKPKTETDKNTSATVSSSRTVTNVGINQWRVDIEIEKQALQGFAKIEESIPSGYTAIDLKASGAIFSIDEREIKYIWYDFPETQRVMVSYKMLPVVAMQGKSPEITGVFSFLQNDVTITLPIGEGLIADEMPLAMDNPFAQEEEETVEAMPEPAPEKVDPAKATPVSPQPAVAKPETKPEPARPAATPTPKPTEATAQAKEQKPKPKPADPSVETTTQKAYTDANIVGVPPPEKGVYYRVQIAAGKNNLSSDLFAKLYLFKEGFKMENHAGWIKYTTGHHQVYKAARDDRERITGAYNKFQGPFVAAYNEGERITVQEALMITSQKWTP